MLRNVYLDERIMCSERECGEYSSKTSPKNRENNFKMRKWRKVRQTPLRKIYHRDLTVFTLYEVSINLHDVSSSFLENQLLSILVLKIFIFIIKIPDVKNSPVERLSRPTLQENRSNQPLCISLRNEFQAMSLYISEVLLV